VIKAEKQAVLNTLTEQDFQDAFQKLQKSWRRCTRAKRELLQGIMVDSRPKVSFLLTAAPVPKIMNGSSHLRLQHDTSFYPLTR
jgi:hypothetical protein